MPTKRLKLSHIIGNRPKLTETIAASIAFGEDNISTSHGRELREWKQRKDIMLGNFGRNRLWVVEAKHNDTIYVFIYPAINKDHALKACEMISDLKMSEVEILSVQEIEDDS